MPFIREAGPENIVPTSSTTTQLALGDSIALACMKVKNFSKFDFKNSSQRSLSLKLKTVEDLMIKGKKSPFKRRYKNEKSFKNYRGKKIRCSYC